MAGLPTSPDLPATAFQNDCVLMLGELHDDQARRDFTAIAQFGARAGIRTYYATKKGVDPSTSRPAHNRASEGSTASLTEDMRYLVDEQKCLDVMIYASGHGSPASGRGSTKRAIVTMTGPITTRRGKRQETKRRLTSTTLKQVVAAFPDDHVSSSRSTPASRAGSRRSWPTRTATSRPTTWLSRRLPPPTRCPISVSRPSGRRSPTPWSERTQTSSARRSRSAGVPWSSPTSPTCFAASSVGVFRTRIASASSHTETSPG